MAVDTVTSSTNAPPVRSQTQTQTDQARSEEQAKKAEQARRDEEAKQARQAENEAKPRPVVNAQGQTTGKVVNTTA